MKTEKNSQKRRKNPPKNSWTVFKLWALQIRTLLFQTQDLY